MRRARIELERAACKSGKHASGSSCVFSDGNAARTIGSETRNDLLAGHDLTAFLKTAEGKELNAAFSKVKSSTVRKRVVVLVKAIASTFPEEASEAK